MHDFRDAATHFVLRRAEILEAEGDFVPHGVADDLVFRALRHVTDKRCRLLRGEIFGRNPEDFERTGGAAVGSDSGFAVAQKRGFAAARSAYQQLKRALRYVPIDGADRALARRRGVRGVRGVWGDRDRVRESERSRADGQGCIVGG